MAGDWIKMRSALFTHPKVVRMASALQADTLRTVGGLMSAWCLFDVHSEDGLLDGYTTKALDDHLRWDGFAAEMMAVGWLEYSPEKGLALPRFDSHNGQSSKRRSQDAGRKRDVRNVSACEADKKRTREEKRREELIQAPPAARVPPAEAGQARSSKRCPQSFAPDADLLRWAERGAPAVDLERELAKFRDHAFKTAHKDWPAAFRNWLRRASDDVAQRPQSFQAQKAAEAQKWMRPSKPGFEFVDMEAPDATTFALR